MSVGKAAAGAGKVLFDQYKDGFFDWVERKIKETPKLRKLRDEWIKRDWQKAGEEYLAFLKEYHSQFTVYGIEHRVSLGELGTDVFLHDQLEFRQYSGDTDAKRISGLRLVFNDQRGQKLLLWGTPGAGKTTFLKQVVQAAIDKTEEIPLFVTTAEWVKTFPITYTGLLSYAAQQFKKCSFNGAEIFVDFLIESGTALLLFDGLDEISSEDRRQVHLLLSNLSQSQSQIVITCRTGTYENHLPSPFWEAELTPWDEMRIKNFVTKRLANQKTTEIFFETLDDEKFQSLKNLKDNPLLLSLLCLVFNSDSGFPEDRGKVYQQATRHLIEKRDQHKEKPVSRDPLSGNLTVTQLETLYAHLAYHSFNQNEIYFDEVDLEQRLSLAIQTTLSSEKAQSVDIVKLLPQLISQHGILARRGYNTFAFSHLTFQEYYTAKYLIENSNQYDIKSLANYLKDARWREVLILVASLLKDATRLFEIIQKVSQDILRNDPRLVITQRWVTQRSTYIPAYQMHAKRALYWDLYIKIIEYLYPSHNTQFNTEELDSELIIALGGKKESINTFISRITQSIPNRHSYDEYNLGHHSLSISHDVFIQNLDLDLNKDLIRIKNPQDEYLFDGANFECYKFDIKTIRLIKICTLMTKKELRSKERVEKLQTFLNKWNTMANNLFGLYGVTTCPSLHSTDSEWEFFRSKIFDIASLLVELDFNTTWSSINLHMIFSYWDVNEILWECLQVARVENREEIEEMIFKAPDDNE